ncbi:MAG: hypothetical protein IPK16_13000 [Anaerolineales bacterium]|nr:hypothetical protein [Anaerolineales bacterium]
MGICRWFSDRVDWPQCPLDLGFLRNAGVNFHRPVFDTWELASILLPGLASYSLGELCLNLGIPLLDAHRAADDAEATALLFHALGEQARQLPMPVIQLILDACAGLEWPYEPFFAGAARGRPDDEPMVEPLEPVAVTISAPVLSRTGRPNPFRSKPSMNILRPTDPCAQMGDHLNNAVVNCHGGPGHDCTQYRRSPADRGGHRHRQKPGVFASCRLMGNPQRPPCRRCDQYHRPAGPVDRKGPATSGNSAAADRQPCIAWSRPQGPPELSLPAPAPCLAQGTPIYGAGVECSRQSARLVDKDAHRRCRRNHAVVARRKSCMATHLFRSRHLFARTLRSR